MVLDFVDKKGCGTEHIYHLDYGAGGDILGTVRHGVIFAHGVVDGDLDLAGAGA